MRGSVAEEEDEKVSSITGVGSNSSASNAISKATKELGKDEFLKLLLTELKYQDAQDPVKDKEFIAQMAQFSSLEQTTNLVEAFDKMAARANNNEALGMLGSVVSAVDPDSGAIIEGLVTSLKLNAEDPELSVLTNDQKVKVVKLSEVNEVGIVT